MHPAPAEVHSYETTLSTPDLYPIPFDERGEVLKFGESVDHKNDNFSDFSIFQSNHELDVSNVEPSDDFSGVESASSCNSYFEGEHHNTGIVENADDFHVPKEAVDNRTSSSHYVNKCNIETLPIPNNDSSSRKDLIIDQHRQIVNDKHYASDSDDGSCKRFQKNADLTDHSDDNIYLVDSRTESEIEKLQEETDCSEDLPKCTVSNQNICVEDCASTSDQELSCPLKIEIDNVEASAKSDVGGFASIGLERSEALFGQSEHTADTLNQPVMPISQETILTKYPFDGALKQETLQSSELFIDFGAFANFESVSVSEPPSFVAAFETPFEPILGSSLESINDAPLNMFPDKIPGTRFTDEVGVIADDVVKSCSLPTIEGATDISPDVDDDDFGYRDIDAGDDIESDCEAGLRRSHRDKREEAVVIEAKNKLVKCAETQHSVEFSNSDHWDHTSVDCKDGLDDDDDEFDDFVVNTTTPVNETDIIEFDKFATAKIDDAFGEFASNTRDCTESKEGSSIDEDDFGEFGTFNSGTSELAADGRKCSVTGLARGTSVDAGPGDGDPLLSRVGEEPDLDIIHC